jgi:peptidoglycan/LPS O-acetylase OafA/YrhL
MNAATNAPLAYRADIDGLRAVAVLAVLAFHAAPALLPGGFAGVDLFFVISGFLITGVLAEALAQDRFSLAAFYKGRITRLLPAYGVVSLAVLAAASYLLIPNDYLFYTTSLAASWAFASNLFFSLSSWGYFGQRSEEFPLLHTWSLAVEEQFYFVFPLLLLVLHRRGRHRAPAVLAALALAGLAWSEWRTGPVASYFLLSCRAHELLMGALAAYAVRRRRPASPAAAAQLAAAGAVLALGALALLWRELPYPGLNTLAPCLGAALLLYAGSRPNPLSALLGRPWLAAIGRLSYSLYLWHWPVLSLLRYRYGALDAPATAAALLLVFVLAWLTWRYVEQPLHRRGTLGLRAAAARYYAAPAAACLALGLYSYSSEGVPQRFDPAARELLASYSFERDLAGACAIKSGAYQGVTLDYLAQRCVAGDPRAPGAALLLFGDSHANHFKPFVEQLARDSGMQLAYFVEGACSAIDLYQGQPGGATPCQRRNADLLAMAPHFRYVALASRWQYLGREPEFARALEPALHRIERAGAVPVLLKDTPTVAPDLPRCVLQRQRGWLPAARNCNMPRRLVEAEQGSMDRVIDALRTAHPTLIVIDPKRVMCGPDECLTSIGRTALYKDDNHINLAAARLLGQRYLALAGNPLRAPAWPPSSGRVSAVNAAARQQGEIERIPPP